MTSQIVFGKKFVGFSTKKNKVNAKVHVKFVQIEAKDQLVR